LGPVTFATLRLHLKLILTFFRRAERLMAEKWKMASVLREHFSAARQAVQYGERPCHFGRRIPGFAEVS